LEKKDVKKINRSPSITWRKIFFGTGFSDIVIVRRISVREKRIVYFRKKGMI